MKGAYIEALKSEIKSNYKGETLETLYFGGGTPSTLSVDEFKELISLFNIDKNTEIAAEVNPEGITEEYLKGLKSIGINRLSIGSQTFDDKILKIIGRRHSAKEIESAVKLAQSAGFENISLDFIYGLPTQRIDEFKSDLEHAVNLGVKHISLYGLKIEKGCYFYKNKPDLLPNLDIQADMYLAASESLKNHGFEHYEISNFSKPDFQSRHNLNYWNNNTYYGFGLSASGYQDKTRYTNECILEKYIKNPLKKMSEEKLDNQAVLEEEIFLGLRKMAGINIESINKKFNIDFENKYKNIIDKFIKTRHLKKTDLGYALTIDGVLVSNEILSEFIE